MTKEDIHQEIQISTHSPQCAVFYMSGSMFPGHDISVSHSESTFPYPS